MKARELMVGDWVTLYGNPTIWCHDDYTKWREEMERTDINTFEPIPLTPEILEKNGFSYPKQSGWMKLDCPERQLWGCLHTDGALWLYASGDCDKDESFAEIRYVHQLQHALRLCGIDKEITL